MVFREQGCLHLGVSELSSKGNCRLRQHQAGRVLAESNTSVGFLRLLQQQREEILAFTFLRRALPLEGCDAAAQGGFCRAREKQFMGRRGIDRLCAFRLDAESGESNVTSAIAIVEGFRLNAEHMFAFAELVVSDGRVFAFDRARVMAEVLEDEFSIKENVDDAAVDVVEQFGVHISFHCLVEVKLHFERWAGVWAPHQHRLVAAEMNQGAFAFVVGRAIVFGRAQLEPARRMFHRKIRCDAQRGVRAFTF